ncbi:MAG: glycoside hydrolase family 43 protein [Muribaculaceae bacterium]
MKQTTAMCIAAAFAATTLFSCHTEKTKVIGEEITFADPTIFVENGKYYLTGTREAGAFGFQLLESTDLANWTACHADTARYMLKKGDNTFGEWGFWAPQIYRHNDKYLLFYTANEQVVVAKSDSITGQFSQSEVCCIDGSEKNIDPFLFKDDDGSYYLYHVRFNNGNYLWSARYDIENDSIDHSTLVRCFGLTDAWEKTDDGRWSPVMEGPTVMKLEGTYYMFYSANHFLNQDYAVGYATAPAPQGPWTKYEGNPIIHKSIVGESGSGHGDFFKGLDGRPYYVYHVHNSDSVVSPRLTRIVPLTMTRTDSTGIYTIVADTTGIIVPHVQ